MYGNVAEWCWGRYGDEYQEPPSPSGPSAMDRVSRGGSFGDPAHAFSSSSSRNGNFSSWRGFIQGFRVARAVRSGKSSLEAKPDREGSRAGDLFVCQWLSSIYSHPSHERRHSVTPLAVDVLNNGGNRLRSLGLALDP